jgi:hypothetical protein
LTNDNATRQQRQQHQQQEGVMKFRDLAIGDVFKFASPHSPWPGPWVKVSARQYSSLEKGDTTVKITVGTVLVEVERLEGR